MAMLAEPRRKQRIGPNPRGKFFTDDEDNRGRQMLLKMGWNRGDGLGSSSQGMSEPIKPKIHTDARGLGYDMKKDPWVAHNEEFEELLKNLNSSAGTNEAESKCDDSGDGEEDSVSSGLEKKSKFSRSRIHYHKFVKNKDLSRASSKDISCIFGKPVSTDGLAERSTETLAYGVTLPEVEESKPDNSDVASENGDIKKKKKKRKRDKKNKNGEEAEEINVVFEAPVTGSEEVGETVSEDVQNRKKKKKKKRKHRDDESEPSHSEFDANGVVTEDGRLNTDTATDIPIVSGSGNNVEVETSVSIKKKKKSKKRKCSDESDNDSTCLISEASIPECQTNNASEEQEYDKKRKKSKKRKRNDERHEEDASSSSCQIPETSIPEECQVNNGDEEGESVKKKKKKRKRDASDSNDSNTDQTNESRKTEVAPQVEPPNEKVESFGSMQFINRGSIEDYFKNKRLQLLNRVKQT